MKYICSDYNGKCYLRGLCCAREDYSDWETIETNFDADNKYLNDEGRPVHRVIDDKIIYEPLEKSEAELIAEKEKEEKELYIAAMPDLVKELQAKIQILQEEVNVLKVAKEVTK